MNISQWKIGDRTFFSLEVDDRLLLIRRSVLKCSLSSRNITVHISQGFMQLMTKMFTDLGPGNGLIFLRWDKGTIINYQTIL